MLLPTSPRGFEPTTSSQMWRASVHPTRLRGGMRLHGASGYYSKVRPSITTITHTNKTWSPLNIRLLNLAQPAPPPANLPLAWLLTYQIRQCHDDSNTWHFVRNSNTPSAGVCLPELTMTPSRGRGHQVLQGSLHTVIIFVVISVHPL